MKTTEVSGQPVSGITKTRIQAQKKRGRAENKRLYVFKSYILFASNPFSLDSAEPKNVLSINEVFTELGGVSYPTSLPTPH